MHNNKHNHKIDDFDFVMHVMPSHSIQVGNAKQAMQYVNNRAEAVNFKFIKFGNKYFIPTLSLDCETKRSIEEIRRICSSFKIPLPNLVVETTRGQHIHWLLKYPVKTTNPKQLKFYQQIITQLIDIFDADRVAVMKRSGRIWRNPLKNPSRSLSCQPVELSQFAHLFEHSICTKPSRSTKSLGVKNIDFSTVKVGERHMTLFHFVRQIAYRAFKSKSDWKSYVAAVAHTKNAEMPEPLPIDEVESIITSIINWIETNYSGHTTNEAQIEFNRKLAQKKWFKTADKVNSVFFRGLLTLRDLKHISVRQFAKLTGLPKSTAHRALKKFIEFIKWLSGESHARSPFESTAVRHVDIATDGVVCHGLVPDNMAVSNHMFGSQLAVCGHT